MKIRMPSKQAVATMRFGLTVVAQHVARAKQPGDADSKRSASARGKEGRAGAAQRAGADHKRHVFQCAIGASVPVEDRDRMGPRAVAVTQVDERIAILQRTGRSAATKRAASIAGLPRVANHPAGSGRPEPAVR